MNTFTPTHEDEAAACIAEAHRNTTPLRIVGGGSKQGLGRPVQTHHSLSTACLSGIRLYEPKELVVVVGAGTRVQDLEETLSKHGQRLSFEPPDLGPVLGITPNKGTVGGLVACNLSGPRRIRDGAARDNILGLRLINGRGEIIKTGGRVMKNVTGLDLCKIVTGSYGTTGLVTEVALKVLPCPDHAVTLCIFGLESAEGCRMLREALATPWEVSGGVHLPPKLAKNAPSIASDRAVTLIRIEGFEEQVGYRFSRLKAHLLGVNPNIDIDALTIGHETLWRWVRDCCPFTNPCIGQSDQGLHDLIWRLSLRPTDGPAFAARLKSMPDFETSLFWYDWGGGLVFLVCSVRQGDDPAYATEIRKHLADFGGHATLLRASETIRATVPPFQPPSKIEARLERGILRAFDPEGLLNPGRMRPQD